METCGKVGEFCESVESWTQYVKRLKQYFERNEIKDGKKRRAILLSNLWEQTYGLIKDLSQPKKPGEAEVKEIYAALERHFSPEPSITVGKQTTHPTTLLVYQKGQFGPRPRPIVHGDHSVRRRS